VISAAIAVPLVFWLFPSGSGHHHKGPSTKFIHEMCDTNEGGYYHDDPECVRRYLGQ
jgi:hypothetical protein